MELDTLRELIRTDEAPAPDLETVDRMVGGALHRGRRTLVGRRAAAGVAAGALLATAAAVAVQLPGRPVEVGPADPPATTVASPTSTPRPTPSPTRAAAVEPPTRTEVSKVIRAAMPGFTGSRYSPDFALDGEVAVAYTATDRAGRAWVAGGIDNEIKKGACAGGPDCRREPLAGGTLLVMPLPKGKIGEGAWYYYHRSDGSWVWFGQQNAFPAQAKKITRPTVPLDKAEVRALLTAPAWDPLVQRCRAAGPAC